MAKSATAQWPKEAVARGSKAGALAKFLIGAIPIGRNDYYQPKAVNCEKGVIGYSWPGEPFRSCTRKQSLTGLLSSERGSFEESRRSHTSGQKQPVAVSKNGHPYWRSPTVAGCPMERLVASSGC